MMMTKKTTTTTKAKPPSGGKKSSVSQGDTLARSKPRSTNNTSKSSPSLTTKSKKGKLVDVLTESTSDDNVDNQNDDDDDESAPAPSSSSPSPPTNNSNIYNNNSSDDDMSIDVGRRHRGVNRDDDDVNNSDGEATATAAANADVDENVDNVDIDLSNSNSMPSSPLFPIGKPLSLLSRSKWAKAAKQHNAKAFKSLENHHQKSIIRRDQKIASLKKKLAFHQKKIDFLKKSGDGSDFSEPEPESNDDLTGNEDDVGSNASDTHKRIKPTNTKPTKKARTNAYSGTNMGVSATDYLIQLPGYKHIEYMKGEKPKYTQEQLQELTKYDGVGTKVPRFLAQKIDRIKQQKATGQRSYKIEDEDDRMIRTVIYEPNSFRPTPMTGYPDHRKWEALRNQVVLAELANKKVSIPHLVDLKYHMEIEAQILSYSSINHKGWITDHTQTDKIWEWIPKTFFSRILSVYPPSYATSEDGFEGQIENLKCYANEADHFMSVSDYLRSVGSILQAFQKDKDVNPALMKRIITKIKNAPDHKGDIVCRSGKQIALKLEKDSIPECFMVLLSKWQSIRQKLINDDAFRGLFANAKSVETNKVKSDNNNHGTHKNQKDKSKSKGSNNNPSSKTDHSKSKEGGKQLLNTHLSKHDTMDADGVCRCCGSNKHTPPYCYHIQHKHPGVNKDMNKSWAESDNGKAYKALDFAWLCRDKYPNGNKFDYNKHKSEQSDSKGKSKYLNLLNIYENNLYALEESLESSYTLSCTIGDGTLSDFDVYCHTNCLIDTGALQNNYINLKTAAEFEEMRLKASSKQLISSANLNPLISECVNLSHSACNFNFNQNFNCQNCSVETSKNPSRLGKQLTNNNSRVCSGLQGVPCLEAVGELYFDLQFPATTSYDVRIYRNIKAIILDTPYDLIIGRPDIVRYDLLDILSSQFKQAKLRKDELTGLRESDERPHATHSATDLTQRSAIHVQSDFNHIYSKDELLDPILDDDGMLTYEEEFSWEKDDNVTNVLPTKPRVEGPPELVTSLEKLILEFDNIFSEELRETPADLTPMIINVDLTKWHSKKHRLPPRTQTRAKEYEIERQIKKMLANNVIKPSQAAYYSQVHMTPKPNGKWRFCIDYRYLNDLTESMGWPIPNVSKMLQRLGNKKAKYYAVVDLTSGYHQAPLSKQSQAASAFMTFMGVYEWVRVPMGLKTAPSHFQQQMAETVLCGLIYHNCEVYLDDVIIHGKTEQQFIQNLREVFERFQEHGITLNPAKCKFGLKEIEYVGHTINEEGLSFSREKLGVVLDFPLPTDHESMKSFLGLVNYFRDHVRNHSIIVKPLSDMVEGKYTKHKRIVWTPELRERFEEVKNIVANCPSLSFMDDNLPVYLHTDASDYGIGGYLFQVDAKSKEKAIAFFSKSLAREQLNWSVPEKEAFAIYSSIKKFEYLIRDVFFTLRTDHLNLTYINDSGSAKVRRWKMAIQEYNFNVEHIKGELNVVADAFSRLVIHHGKVNESTLMVRSQITITKLPTNIRKIIGKVHNSLAGHNGVEKTISKLESQGVTPWQYMREHIKHFIEHCPVCQKLSERINKNFTEPFTTAVTEPMHTLNMDAIGEVPTDEEGYCHILVIVCCFTRFVELYAIKDVTGKEAARCLIQHIGRYGAPRYLRSDRGPQFVNSMIEELLKVVGIKHQLTLAYSKEENGLVERANKEVNKHLRSLLHEFKSVNNWSMYLPLAQRIMNASVHSSIGVAPATLVFGNAISLDRGIFLDTKKMANSENVELSLWSSKMLEMQTKLFRAARLNQEVKDIKHKRKSSPKRTEFAVGTFVLVQYRTRPPSKFHMPWAGPMKVVKVDKSNYSLQDMVTLKIRDYHITQLKEFKYDSIDDDPIEVARNEQQEFVVATILSHRGSPRARSELEFLVKWEGYDESYDSWEPWDFVKDNIHLNQYLYRNKMKRFLTKEQKLEVEQSKD